VLIVGNGATIGTAGRLGLKPLLWGDLLGPPDRFRFHDPAGAGFTNDAIWDFSKFPNLIAMAGWPTHTDRTAWVTRVFDSMAEHPAFYRNPKTATISLFGGPRLQLAAELRAYLWYLFRAYDGHLHSAIDSCRPTLKASLAFLRAIHETYSLTVISYNYDRIVERLLWLAGSQPRAAAP
jgi:hypothetical protein